MSSRFQNPRFLMRLKDILQRCLQSVFCHRLENCLAKMSKNCLCEMSYKPLYEMSFRQPCKISSRFVNPTFFRHLKDILLRCLKCPHKTSLRHLQDIFLPTWGTCPTENTSSLHPENFLQENFLEKLLLFKV